VQREVPDIGDDFRCTYVKSNGNRCGQERVDPSNSDFTWCRFHASAALRQAGVKIPESALPNAGELNPAALLLEEITRTRLNIAFYESIVADMEPEELVQATTTEEREGGQGGGYTLERVEPKPSPYVELLERERQHLAQVVRYASQMGIEERQLALNEQLAATVLAAMRGFVLLAGLNAGDPQVKQWMVQALQAAQSGRVVDVPVDRAALTG
jgi:hypothetical protein